MVENKFTYPKFSNSLKSTYFNFKNNNMKSISFFTWQYCICHNHNHLIITDMRTLKLTVQHICLLFLHKVSKILSFKHIQLIDCQSYIISFSFHSYCTKFIFLINQEIQLFSTLKGTLIDLIDPTSIHHAESLFFLQLLAVIETNMVGRVAAKSNIKQI